MMRIFLIAAFSLALSGGVSHADSVCDWDCAWRRAAAHNPDYLSARRSYEAVLSDYHARWNQLFPSLTLSTGYSDSDSSSNASRWNARATAAVDIFNAKNVADVRRAAAALDMAEARFRLISADLRFATQRSFIDLLTAQQMVIVSQRIKDIRQSSAQTVALKYEAGRESKGNRLRAQAELSAAQAELKRAERNLRVAQREFNRRLGHEGFTVSVVTGSFVPSALNVNAGGISVADDHPRLKELSAQVASARASVADANSAMWPSLSASYTRSATGPDYFPDEKHWSLSGVLSYPLFSGGPTFSYYARRAARQSFEKAELDYRAGFLGLESDLEAAWAAFADTLDAIEVQEQFLAASRQRNEESTIRYSLGHISFDDWELAVADLVNAERADLRSRREALVAEAQWRRLLGEPLEEL